MAIEWFKLTMKHVVGRQEKLCKFDGGFHGKNKKKNGGGGRGIQED